MKKLILYLMISVISVSLLVGCVTTSKPTTKETIENENAKNRLNEIENKLNEIIKLKKESVIEKESIVEENITIDIKNNKRALKNSMDKLIETLNSKYGKPTLTVTAFKNSDNVIVIHKNFEYVVDKFTKILVTEFGGEIISVNTFKFNDQSKQ